MRNLFIFILILISSVAYAQFDTTGGVNIFKDVLGDTEVTTITTITSGTQFTSHGSFYFSPPLTVSGISLNHSDLTLDDGTNPHSTTKSDVGLGNVENTALSTWAGSANITTLGTIGTGVWNGTVIDSTYLDTNVTLDNVAETVTGDWDFTGSIDFTDIFIGSTPTTSRDLNIVGDISWQDTTGVFQMYESDTAKTWYLVLDGSVLDFRKDTTAAANSVLNIASSNVRVGLNNEGFSLGDDTNATAYMDFNSRAFVGYDSGSTMAVIQGASGRGIEFNVNNNTFGSGTVGTVDTAGAFNWTGDLNADGDALKVVAADPVLISDGTFTPTSDRDDESEAHLVVEDKVFIGGDLHVGDPLDFAGIFRGSGDFTDTATTVYTFDLPDAGVSEKVAHSYLVNVAASNDANQDVEGELWHVVLVDDTGSVTIEQSSQISQAGTNDLVTVTFAVSSNNLDVKVAHNTASGTGRAGVSIVPTTALN